jgi:hypothetical protein
MAIRSSLRCEIRAVVLHLWPDEIKVHPHVRVTIPVGRRGQPVQKLRYMPLAQAHKVARKLQGTPGAAVSTSRNRRHHSRPCWNPRSSHQSCAIP